MTFCVNTSIPSSVVLNEYAEFAGVEGQYRVYNMKVYNSESGKYETIDLDGTYTIAATNYYLLEYGSGMKMLESVKVIQSDGMLDVEVLEKYITEKLGGVISEEYAETKVNIYFTDGEITDIQENDNQENNGKNENSMLSLVKMLIKAFVEFLRFVLKFVF